MSVRSVWPNTDLPMHMPGHLPKDRAEDCKDEYQQVAYAYEKLVGQHIDPILAKMALDKNWLPDAKWRVPRRPGSVQTK